MCFHILNIKNSLLRGFQVDLKSGEISYLGTEQDQLIVDIKPMW